MIDETAVISALATILEGITDIKAVHEGVPGEWTDYPAATIYPLSWEEEYADLRDTKIVAVFRIGIHVTYDTATDLPGAQAVLWSIVNQVKEELGKQENIDLGGAIDFSSLSSGSFLFDTKEANQVYCLIDYKATKRFNRHA